MFGHGACEARGAIAALTAGRPRRPAIAAAAGCPTTRGPREPQPPAAAKNNHDLQRLTHHKKRPCRSTPWTTSCATTPETCWACSARTSMNFCGSRTRRCGRRCRTAGSSTRTKAGASPTTSTRTRARRSGRTRRTIFIGRSSSGSDDSGGRSCPTGAGTSGAGVVGLHLDGRAGAGRRRRDAVHPDAAAQAGAGRRRRGAAPPAVGARRRPGAAAAGARRLRSDGALADHAARRLHKDGGRAGPRRLKGEAPCAAAPAGLAAAGRRRRADARGGRRRRGP